MLIEVIKENEVVSCRLTTGEELVARLSKDKRDDGFVELSTPPLIVGRGPRRIWSYAHDDDSHESQSY